MDILKEIIIQHFWGWESCEEKKIKRQCAPIMCVFIRTDSNFNMEHEYLPLHYYTSRFPRPAMQVSYDLYLALRQPQVKSSVQGMLQFNFNNRSTMHIVDEAQPQSTLNDTLTRSSLSYVVYQEESGCVVFCYKKSLQSQHLAD